MYLLLLLIHFGVALTIAVGMIAVSYILGRSGFAAGWGESAIVAWVEREPSVARYPLGLSGRVAGSSFEAPDWRISS